ncbi:uncharacterized protein G6M90_00g023930 [Metarhizium brunneum]|uniref:Uncharacterized protein n=1 Tax=Metarhizium brunneum TaxID=500148 RepID=A0A7D5Z3P9_9HYPO|nr:hypothetical protein G6M90_00g023930 [Metarhizium brunneum]
MAAKAFGPNEASARTAQPFNAWDIIRPSLHASGGPWGWTHYGIYIPRLPQPYQYLNVLILVGLVDLTIFNHAEFAPGGPKAVVHDAEHLTTVMTSTASKGHHFVRGYDSSTDCEFPDSGTPLRWGKDFSMEFTFPHKAVVTGAFETHGWEYRLEFDMSPQAVWFIATPFYEHLSLPISGTAILSGERIPISGCIEYARCKPPPGLPLEMHAAVARSTNYFIYHVVELRDSRQILWGEVRNGFMPPRKFVYVRTVPDGRVLDEYTTELRVELLDDELVTDSLGRQTRMPTKFTASVVVGSGRKVLEVAGRVNTPLRDGAGRGFVGGYDAVVTYKGEETRARGMFEWVDLELQEQKANL